MKIISIYLPQFHRVAENDEWWGEGFTEWRTVKCAEKLFDKHYQPHIPLNHNYYDLLDKETMKWQEQLMKKYGIDGQCFYHYWFKDGKQILEKPAENLMKWKEIDIPFCFCWANQTWARTWSKISDKNVWASTYEKQEEISGNGILLEQKYGREEQWREHFNYLLPFFKDNRYIKIDNNPVFLIYKSSLIPCLNEMILKWNEWAKSEGFNKIYIIGANSNSNVEKSLDAILYHEPQYTVENLNNRNNRKGLLKVEYDDVWKALLSFQSVKKNALYEGFVGYDDTPRRGEGGIMVDHASPEKFKQYFSELIAKNIANGNELIFLNAWNEWGEGMHLEPDEKYGYQFLEAVAYAKEHYKEYIEKYGPKKVNNDTVNEIEYLLKKNARYESYWTILDTWLRLKEENIKVEKYFADRKIKSIAIYGMGMLGKHLLEELKDSDIQIVYGIDRNTNMQSIVPVYSPDDDLPEVDTVVVTATYAYVEIASVLNSKGCKKIVSLAEVLSELL